MTIDYSDLPKILCPICNSESFTQVTVRFDSGRIVECSNCKHIYLNPTLTDEMLNSIYNEYHISENDELMMNIIDGWFRDPRGPYQYAISSIELDGGFAGKQVLEIGCGPGRFLSECKTRGAFVKGVDISPGAVRLAKQCFNLDLIPKTIEQAIIENDVQPSTFDLIFAFELIEHVKKPGNLLRSLYSLLKPGGLLFISTPNFHLFYLMGSIAPVVIQWPEHVHFFDPLSLETCLNNHDFETLNIITLMPLSYGDRRKQSIIRMPLAKTIWQLLRRYNFIYTLKDMLFNSLDNHKEAADIKCWNGTCLIAIAKKPIK